jgi:hypothetical protein
MSTLYLTEQRALVTKTDGRLLVRKDGAQSWNRWSRSTWTA